MFQVFLRVETLDSGYGAAIDVAFHKGEELAFITSFLRNRQSIFGNP